MRIKQVSAAMIIALVASLTAFAALPAAATPSNHDIDYSFTFINGTTLAGNASTQDAVLVGGGNNGAMTVHVSCSDVFADGWGTNGSPTLLLDGAGWQISSYSIQKYHTTAVSDERKLIKSCRETFCVGGGEDSQCEPTSCGVGDEESECDPPCVPAEDDDGLVARALEATEDCDPCDDNGRFALSCCDDETYTEDE
ncbi:hypothetical protein OAM92_02360, partial [Acidimicrobiales bacterium]|nr:hypothetical protein [Acidimicrobiales bacterium]